MQRYLRFPSRRASAVATDTWDIVAVTVWSFPGRRMSMRGGPSRPQENRFLHRKKGHGRSCHAPFFVLEQLKGLG